MATTTPLPTSETPPDSSSSSSSSSAAIAAGVGGGLAGDSGSTGTSHPPRHSGGVPHEKETKLRETLVSTRRGAEDAGNSPMDNPVYTGKKTPYYLARPA